MPHIGTSEVEDGVEEIGAADATGNASPASGLVALAVVPPVMIPPTELCAKRRIILPFVERSTRYACSLISSLW